jgi:hypothetical protein
MAFDPLTAALDIGSKLIDKFFPDPIEKQKAQLALLQMQQSGQLAQLTADTQLAQAQDEINKAEAANASSFVSGWRPFIGWICGAAIGYMLLLRPILPWVIAVVGGKPVPPMPEVSLNDVLMLLGPMLGLGAMRTVEKIQGVAGGPH